MINFHSTLSSTTFLKEVLVEVQVGENCCELITFDSIENTCSIMAVNTLKNADNNRCSQALLTAATELLGFSENGFKMA